MTRRIVQLLAVAGVCLAGDGTFSAPSAAIVLDASSPSLRLISGLPGGALLGDTMAQPFTPSAVAMCPTRNLAVVTARDASVWLAANLGNAAPSFVKMEGARATGLALSADCSSALLYSASDEALRFASGLPQQTQLGDPIPTGPSSSPQPEGPTLNRGGSARGRNLSSNGAVKVLAVSPDGSQGLIAAGRQLYLVRRNSGELIPVPSAGESFAAVFLSNGTDALTLDYFRSEVALIHDISGQAVRTPLLSAHDGLIRPTAIELLDDNTFLVLSEGNNTIYKAGITSGGIHSIPAPASANRLDRTFIPGVFLLNQPGSDNIHLLDGNNVFFVPAK